MTFSKTWKSEWKLKSLSFEELLNIVKQVVMLQLEGLEKETIKLDGKLIIDYEADSVDIVAMLLHLEDLFKNPSQSNSIVVPTDKLGQIILVEDLFDVIYDALLNMENKMEIFNPIKPNLEILKSVK